MEKEKQSTEAAPATSFVEELSAVQAKRKITREKRGEGGGVERDAGEGVEERDAGGGVENTFPSPKSREEQKGQPISQPPPTHSVGSKQREQQDTNGAPAWRVALLEKRKNKGKVEEPQEEEVKQPPVILDKDGKPLPSWKTAVLVMKQEKIEQIELEKKRAAEAKEAPYIGMPVWKKKMLKERHLKQERISAAEALRQKEIQDKLNEIAAMPEWKRDLFLKKNPDFRELM